MIEMMTLNGAKALGLDDKVGSIEKGKEADIIAMRIYSVPVYNPIATVVYVGTNKYEKIFFFFFYPIFFFFFYPIFFFFPFPW
jgi:imidazolonepropionase-like amidohydrolase